MRSQPTRGPADAPSLLQVEVQLATRRPWAPGTVTLRRCARAAHAGGLASLPVRRRRMHAVVGQGAAACLRIVGSTESRRLDREYRGKDRPTNVLSFPSSPEERVATGTLGDLVICAPVVAREAREQRKTKLSGPSTPERIRWCISWNISANMPTAFFKAPNAVADRTCP